MRLFCSIQAALLCAVLAVPAYGADQSLPDLKSLQEFSAPAGSTLARDVLAKVRSDALKLAATSLGARGGLAWRSSNINQVLDRRSDQIDASFDFNRMLLPHSVLCPVLLEARNTYNQPGTDVLRVADQMYKIDAQARFVSKAPLWRDYIYKVYGDVEKPHPSLLPRTDAERNLWRGWVEDGWKAGVDQADIIFEEDMNRLVRDYAGMIRYRILLGYGMVTLPFVSEAKLGVTGGGADMSVNDRVLRITAKPALDVNTKNWKAVVLP